MAIDPKKYTKDQMAKMVEDAQRSNGTLEVQISGLCAQIDKKNDALSEYANEKEALKADADALRTKLADTEAALGRANNDLAFKGTVIDVMREGRYNAEQRADYAEAHPWRNLWAWVKRKLVRHE